MAKTKRRPAVVVTARLAALRAATRKIGDTAHKRLAWLVEFVEEDPAEWQPADAEARGDCLLALGHAGFLENWYPLKPDDLPDPLDATAVTELHAELRRTLRALVGEEPTPYVVMLPTDGRAEGLVRITAVGKKPAGFATSAGHVTLRTAVFAAVRDLVLQAGDRLIACLAPGRGAPRCGAPFVAHRKQMFCSSTCAQRARNARREEKRRRAGR